MLIKRKEGVIHSLVVPKHNERRKKRDLRNFQEDAYLDDLRSISLDQNLIENNDINNLYENFNNALIRTIDKHAPPPPQRS